MPELTAPTPRVQASFLAAMAEFVGEGRGSADDHSMIGREFREFGPTWDTDAGFAAYVAQLRSESSENTARPDGWVPSVTYWYVDGPAYLGRVALRVRLNDSLLEVGGHIGYDVRPTARRRGYATAMLAGALLHARDLGIDPALLTCDVDNVGSRTIIERAGGVLEDIRPGKRRYWVPTGSA